MSPLKLLRTKQRRKDEVSRLLEECRAMGFTVHEVHPKTKEVIGFTAHDLSVKLSALAHSKDTFPSGWFLLEARALPKRRLALVIEQGLKMGHPGLYGHLILGMGLAKLTQAAAFLSSDDGADYFEVVPFDEAVFKSMLQTAALLSSCAVPPKERTYECTVCHFERHCWDPLHIPDISCASCHYSCLRDGSLYCTKYANRLEIADADAGCTEHLFKPGLVGFATFLRQEILPCQEIVHIYKIGEQEFANCGAKAVRTGQMYTSRELKIAGVATITDPRVQALKDQFAVKIIEYTSNGSNT